MEIRVEVHERFMNLRQANEFERSMNAALGMFIADAVAAKGAGDYSVTVIDDSYHSSSDYRTFVIRATKKDGVRVDVPYPQWERVAAWASFFTVSATGKTAWHELTPQHDIERGIWWSAGRTQQLPNPIDIPVGIDWRTLCFERPTSTILRHKLASWNEGEEAIPDNGGFLSGLRKFLP